MDSELALLAGEISPYANAAARTYGGTVLATAPDQAADSAAGLGRQMLQRIFGTPAQGQTPEPVADLAADPGNPDLQAALRVAIAKMLTADPDLPRDLRAMLAGASPASEPVPTGRAAKSAWASFRQWSVDHKLKFAGIFLTFIAAIATPAIPLLASSGNGGSGSTSQNQIKANHNSGGEFDAGGNINNINNNASAGLSNNPQQRIVQLTGSYTQQGFIDAIVDRNTTIVTLYLKSGMTAAILHEGASAILFGFQGVPQNGDPVALVKTFQANGFKLDDELEDSYLMGALTDNIFPLQFDTDLTPAGYTGGYQDGTFVGSLLFWIVQRALGSGPTSQDIQVIKYLISQGADCNVTLSFMESNTSLLSGLVTDSYNELLPMMRSCAKPSSTGPINPSPSPSGLHVYSASSYGFSDPTAIVVDGAHVWVTNVGGNGGEGSVTELNASNGSQPRNLSGGTYGFSDPIAIAADGTSIWVADDEDNSVSELNAADGSSVRALSPGSDDLWAPSAVAADGTHIWVANADGNSVTELNASDGSWVRTLSGGHYGFDGPVAIAADSTHVWVVNGSRDSVIELNASDGTLVRVLSGGHYGFDDPVAIASDSTHLWVANAGGSVTELNASDGSWVRTLSGGNYGLYDPAGIAVANAKVWVTNSGGDSVTELNANDGEWVQTLSGGAYSFHDPAGIAVAGADVWVTNSGGNSVTELNASDS